jgi:hypothetical protein
MPSVEAYQTPVCRTLDPLDLNRDRESVLSPYLGLLGVRPGEEETGVEVPLVLPVGEESLSLEEWERRALRQYRGRADEEGRPWPVFLAEGIAFRAKCLERFGRLEPERAGLGQEEAAAEIETSEELVSEIGTGIALKQELQWSIDSLIHEGELGIARRLTAFRNSVSRCLAAYRGRVGGETYERASERSLDLVGSVPVMAPRPEPEAEAAPKRATARYRTRPKPARPVLKARRLVGSRVRPLLVLLVLSAAGWGAFTLLRSDYVPPPALGSEHFAHLGAVRSVAARPPSLYLVLDAQAWDRMTAEARGALVEEVGRIASRAGYLGAHLRTSEGTAAAEWLRERGGRLIEVPSEAS